MKKWLLIECIVLSVLLVAAIAVCIDLPEISKLEGKPSGNTSLSGDRTPQPEAPSDPGESAQPGDPSQPTQPQPTEPEPTWPQLPEDRVLTAQKAFVYSVDQGKFTFLLGGKDERIYPASITKLMTAYVALKYLKPEQTITAGSVLELVGVGSSIAHIQQGDTLTVERLVEAMLLPSGNDAAYILADAAGRKIAGRNDISAWDAVIAFEKEMNAQAKALGMTGTNFKNPDGYHEDDHYTTFADMVVMSKHVLSNETIMKYAVVAEDTMELAAGPQKWENTNELVRPGSQWYCPIATGLKTGQTPSAGSCLLSSFEYKGRQWIIGVFHCPEKDDRFPDTLQLLNEALKTGG